MTDTKHPTAGTTPSRSNDGPSDPCLVVLKGDDLGKNYELDTEILIGRSEDMDLSPSGDPTVSRRHAKIEKTGGEYLIRDLDSSHGTYVNEKPISEQPLSHGDVIRIGATLMKFLSDDVEATFHDEIYRLTTTDAVTGTYNERYFLQELEREVSRCLEHERPCGLVILRLHDLSELNQRYGRITGDQILQQAVQKLSPHTDRDDITARLSGSTFAVLSPDSSPEQFEHHLKEACQTLSSTDYSTPDDSNVTVSISAGLAWLRQVVESRELSPDDTEQVAREFRRAAEDARYAARRLGDKQVLKYQENQAADPARHSGIWHRPVNRQSLIEAVQTDPEDYEAVVACELARDTQLIEKAGISGQDEWNRDFINVVTSQLQSGDLFCVWKERCVLVALHESCDRDAERFEGEVHRAWTAKFSESSTARDDLKEPCFASASASGEELKDFSEESLSNLIVRLDSSEEERELINALPHPISILYAILPTRRNSLGRVRAMIDLLDMGYRFLAAIAISLHLDMGGEDRLEKVADVIEPMLGRSPSSGAWSQLTFHLARELPQQPRSAAHEVVLSLLDDRMKSSELKKTLDEAVALRNDVVHERTGHEDSYDEIEQRLRASIDMLVDTMRPLADTRLVSVDETRFTDDPKLVEYDLRLHRGPTEYFPLIEENFTEHLLPRWCYLIDDDDTPLLLAPFLFVDVCEECSRIEMFLTEKLVFGPENKDVKAKGLTTNHEASKSIAWTPEIRDFHDLLN